MRLSNKGDAPFRIIENYGEHRQELSPDNTSSALSAKPRNPKTYLWIFEFVSGKFKPFDYSCHNLICSARSGVGLLLNFAPCEQLFFGDEFIVERNRSGVAGVELEEALTIALKAARHGGS